MLNLFQPFEFSLSEFESLEKIQQVYQLTSCLSKKHRKNEVTIVFWCFHLPKNKFFSKTLKISATNSFFPKNDKNFLFNGWNQNLCERSKKIEVEDRIQKTDREDEETIFGLPGAVRSLRIFEEVGGGFGKKNLQGWERRSSGKFTILLVFLRKRRRWAFSLNKYASGLGSTNLSRILRFNFSYETDFWANSFVAQKSSEMSPLSGSSPVFFSQPLAAQTS